MFKKATVSKISAEGEGEEINESSMNMNNNDVEYSLNVPYENGISAESISHIELFRLSNTSDSRAVSRIGGPQTL